MNLAEPFVRRPVATTLLAIGLLVVGFAAYRQLPVASLPTVDMPTLQISASWPGADPATMSASVAAPLERRLGSIAGVTEMTYCAGSIHAEFAGDAAAFVSTVNDQAMLILGALVAIYILLGVLYESFVLVHPLAILSTLPSVALGALLILKLTGTDLTLIAFIGIILLSASSKRTASCWSITPSIFSGASGFSLMTPSSRLRVSAFAPF